MRPLPRLDRNPRSGVRRPPVPGRPPAWQRRWRRHRRLLAAALAGVVVWSLATDLAPPEPATRLVVTAAHDLPPGASLASDDLVMLARPVDSLPADPVGSPAAVVGRVVATPVRAGEVLRQRDIVGRALLESLGPDVVATPVRLSDDATLATLRPGDLVDVVAARAADGSNPSRALVVAARVRVLTVGSGSSGTASGLLGATATSASPLLLLATSPEQALDIAASVVGSRLSVTLRAG